MENTPIEYTPTVAQPAKTAAPEYVLVDDVTHLPPPKRGPQVLTVTRYDKNDKRVEVKVRVPFPPNPKCKHCYGRGYLGLVAGTKEIMPCRKCYPFNK